MTDKPKRDAPKSVRLKPEERLRLASLAAAFGLSESAYVIWRTLYHDTPPPRSRGKSPIKDHQAIATLLAKLGSSHIAGNLNQLAKAANSGALVLTPDVAGDLHEAKAEISEMLGLLIKALGLSEAASSADAP